MADVTPTVNCCAGKAATEKIGAKPATEKIGATVTTGHGISINKNHNGERVDLEPTSTLCTGAGSRSRETLNPKCANCHSKNLHRAHTRKKQTSRPDISPSVAFEPTLPPGELGSCTCDAVTTILCTRGHAHAHAHTTHTHTQTHKTPHTHLQAKTWTTAHPGYLRRKKQ